MTLDWQGLVSFEFADDKEMLEDFYLKQKMSIEAIAVKVGVSKQTIRGRLKKHQILIRSRGGKNHTRKDSNAPQAEASNK